VVLIFDVPRGHISLVAARPRHVIGHGLLNKYHAAGWMGFVNRNQTLPSIFRKNFTNVLIEQIAFVLVQRNKPYALFSKHFRSLRLRIKFSGRYDLLLCLCVGKYLVL